MVDAFSRIVRLGEGLGHGNVLSDGAIERTIEALRICKDKMAARSVVTGAAHRDRSLPARRQWRRLHRPGPAVLGLELEVVDRRTEAYLAVTGCASLADPKARSIIVFDIGGGSTEIAWLDGPSPSPFADPCKRIRAWDSLPVGVVTLAERHGGIEVTPEIFEGMVEEVSELLLDFALIASQAERTEHFHLLGTSGTVTTVGGIHLGLARYDRRRVDGLWMRDGDVSSVIDGLIGAPISTAARKIPASAASGPTSSSPVAPSLRRSAAPSPRTACASPIAACARAS